MALQLKKAGVNKVHPLEGGFEEWLALGLPVEAVSEADDSQAEEQLKDGGGVAKA